jgi:CBS-domain-containing membrane protein
MSSPVVTIEAIVSVDYLRDVLVEPFSTFPVLNSAGNMVGVIPKNFLIVLIKNFWWYDEEKLSKE